MAAQTPASGAEDAKNPPDRSRGGHEEDTEGMDCRDTEPQASKPMTTGPSSSYSGGGPTRTLNAGEEDWQTCHALPTGTLLSSLSLSLRYFAANLLEWALEHGFSGVHLDWRGFESPLCGRPGNDAALEAVLRQLRDLARLNRVPLVLALSASTVPAAPGDLVDYYLLEAGDRRCADLDEAGLDTLYRKLRESEASAFSVCWTVSAAVEVFERTVGVRGTHLRFETREPGER
ncbi:hypothetical protein HPB49_000727 [Dermacentor silvarum]|uniref:Uncharacterized protein n=1 Tax=Dermacentor silvarum TaxID=543639 RepID=A0ACB8CNM7_DERSI|nr:hypothetical protein HPB49_000727 [Dermacentor silvarum]